MSPSITPPAGWYATLDGDPAAGATRQTVYLFDVPEIGSFLLTEAGAVIELPRESLWWEWHGPFHSAREARAADLSPRRPGATPMDGRAA